MITAMEIAKRTGVEPYRVRYILDKLREAGTVKSHKVGQTYVYEKEALGMVRKELKKN